MFESVFSSEIRKNAARLISANVISQVIALVVYPVITRQYSPAELGIFNTFMSIFSIFSILSTCKYESAIQLPQSDRDAATLFQLCIKIALITSIFICIILCFGKSFILSVFKMKELANGIWMLPPAILFNAIGITLVCWCNRHKQFKLTSRYLLVQNISSSLFKIILGGIKYTRLGMILSSLIGYVCSILPFVLTKNKQSLFAPLFVNNNAQTARVAKEYDQFPKYNMPHSFVNIISSNLPVLLLAPFFGQSSIGYFGMAMAMGFRPIFVLYNSFYNIFFQRMSEQYRAKSSVLPLFSSFCKKGVIVLLPTFVLIYFFSTPTVLYLLGKEWGETARYLTLILPWLFMTVLGGTFSFIPILFGKQKTALMIEILYAILRIIALSIGIYTQNFFIAIGGYSLVNFTIISLQLIWYYNILTKYERTIRL